MTHAPIAYLDTSAAMKLLVEETESAGLVDALTQIPRRLTSSWLLHTELLCAVGRNPAVLDLSALTTVLDVVTLVDVTRGDLLSAGTHAPLRSNDAIHLATALRIGADEVFTYDIKLADAATTAGLRVVAPV